MLGRVMNVIFGCMFLAAGGYMLFLHLASGEALRSFILLMGGALLAGGLTCLWAGLRAVDFIGPSGPTAEVIC